MQKAFTLIEVVIYLALLSMLLSGALEAAYTLSRSTGGDDTRIDIETEGIFVIEKIDWALSATSSVVRILEPIVGTQGDRLSLIDQWGERVDICRDGDAIVMREGATISLPCGDSSFLPLTSRAKASALHFYHSPDGIEASTTLGGIVFETKRFIP